MCDVRIEGIKCRRTDHALTYYGRNVCENCWNLHCEGQINLKQIFIIEDNEQILVGNL